MQFVEFNSQIEDGKIAVSKTSSLTDGLPVRALVLLDKIADVKKPGNLMQEAFGSEQQEHGREANWFGSHKAGVGQSKEIKGASFAIVLRQMKKHEYFGTQQAHRHHRRAERRRQNDLCARVPAD